MDAHQELLRSVHDHFLATAQWPPLVPLQMKLRHLGHLPKLAAEIGRDTISCDGSGADRACRLTLRGVGRMSRAKKDMARWAFTIEKLAEYYIKNGSGSVKLLDLVAELHLKGLEVRRLGELIHITPGIWSGFGSDEKGFAVITPQDSIWFFEVVRDLEHFYETLDRLNEDERAASRFAPAGYTPPPPVRNARIVDALVRANTPRFVDETRLEELRQLKGTSYDLKRLIAMCEELNRCAANDCLHATVMLTRAIIDHVPPIFGVQNFDQVANNYSGAKSFKESMQHLTTSARRIANGHLHIQIRSKEVLPTAIQVNFSRELDVLLAEVVRILS
jgi:hypothetical protein